MFRVYLGVKTCEDFLCFLAFIFLSSIVLPCQWLLCIHCFMSFVSFKGFYTDDELDLMPTALSLLDDLCTQNVITKKKSKVNEPEMRMSGKNCWRSL